MQLQDLDIILLCILSLVFTHHFFMQSYLISTSIPYFSLVQKIKAICYKNNFNSCTPQGVQLQDLDLILPYKLYLMFVYYCFIQSYFKIASIFFIPVRVSKYFHVYFIFAPKVTLRLSKKSKYLYQLILRGTSSLFSFQTYVFRNYSFRFLPA